MTQTQNIPIRTKQSKLDQGLTEMPEFVFLSDLVTQISLGDGQDVIAWEWTANEEYSSKSAYTARSMPLPFGRREFFLEKGL